VSHFVERGPVAIGQGIVSGEAFCNHLCVQRQRVASRALASVGYDGETAELELEFRSGRVYRYHEVPRSVVDWLLRSPNKGGFVTRMISGRYREQSLPDATASEASVRDGVVSGFTSARAAEPGLSLEQALRASLSGVSGSKRDE